MKEFHSMQKVFEEKCASIPKLKQENEDLKKKLKESLVIISNISKTEEMIQKLVADRDRLRADAAAAHHLRIQVSSLNQQLQASAAALQKMSDEIMASKLQAVLKLKTERHGTSSVETAMELLQDVTFWRKKCIKAESELHDLKVAVAADARRSFLALALRAHPQEHAPLGIK
jgi:hypothetical protein